MSIAAYLQTELVTLSNEARRKHPEIKEAAERVIALLRHPGQGPGSNLSSILSQNQDVLKPFLLACDTKNVKLVTISMGCLRELISHHAMPESAIEVVLKTLNDIMSQGVEIQLKILQTILPLLTNYEVHGESLAEALLLCFRLQDSRVVFVNNTAAATLRQLVIYIFDKVGEEDIRLEESRKASSAQSGDAERPSSEISTEVDGHMEPCAFDAYQLFQDLCLLTNSEQARFLKLGSISRTFGLELIESVLTNHFHLFKQHTELASLLRERVCPLIIKNFSDKHDFPQTMRLMRVVYILIKQFHEILSIECEIFLSMLTKLLEPEGNIQWQRVLAMEIFRGICGDSALLRRIYKTYDQQSTSTDIFGDMIIAIGRLSTEKPLLIGAGGFIQDASDNHKPVTMNERDLSDNGTGSLSMTTSTMRIQCVDQLDKADPPQIPETYLYYLALVCINSIADGLASYVFPIVSQALHERLLGNREGEITEAEAAPSSLTVFPNTNTLELAKTKEADEIPLVTTMAESAWPGLLAAFSYFLSANLDEELFHNVMRAYQNFTSVCGVLQLTTPRDAFLTSLCKNCLPVLSPMDQKTVVSPSGSISQEVTTANLNDKNMYCIRVILNVAQYLGGTLFDSWHLILETMQHAEFLLTVKLHRGSSSAQQAKRQGSIQQNIKVNTPILQGRNTNSTFDTGISVSGPSHQEADVLALLASFKQLFDLTIHLELQSFQSVTRALCRLGAAGCGIPMADWKGSVAPFLKGIRNVNRSEDKSFAIEKLRYICLLNVSRLADGENGQTVWDAVVNFLIETSNHMTPSIRIRMQACDAISDIVIAAMAQAEHSPSEEQEETQMRVMKNLRELIHGHGNILVEIQRMGLETLSKLLQSSGQTLSVGWGLIFDMIQCSIVSPTQRSPGPTPEQDLRSPGTPNGPSGSTKPSGLVRIAFPCLQLICTDFLSLLNATNLQLCIDTLAAFGHQTEDLNISLTSVGLLWNISDFIQQSRREVVSKDGPTQVPQVELDGSADKEEVILLFPDPEVTLVNLDGLWMLLLFRISSLCSDARPEVRNSAIQTLLRTIQINASSLDRKAWRQCIWKILLPLLKRIDDASSTNVQEAAEPVNAGYFVMRSDSPSKQWDETHVLLYSGLADIFQSFMLQLIVMDDYLEAWAFLLDHFETATLFSSPDVAIAALKGIQTVTRTVASAGDDLLTADELQTRQRLLWDKIWTTWERIGCAITKRTPLISPRREEYHSHGRPVTTHFTQEALTEFVNILHHLYPVISATFQLKDLQALLEVTHLLLLYDTSPVYRPDIDYLSPLQSSVHEAIAQLNLSEIGGGPAAVLDQLTRQFLLAFQETGFDNNASDTALPSSANAVTPTYIALCKAAVIKIVDMLEKFQQEKGIYASGAYATVLKALGIAMRLRYSCPPSFKHVEDVPLWKIATTAFLECIKNGVRIVETFEKDIEEQQFQEIWKELLVICYGTMAPSLPLCMPEMPLKNQALDESFDLVFLSCMKSKVFSRMGYHRVPLPILEDMIKVIDNAANLYIPPTNMTARSLTHDSVALTTEEKAKLTLAADSMNAMSVDSLADSVQGVWINLHSTTDTTIPVRRERFAFTCLDILFELCSDCESSNGSVSHSVHKQDSSASESFTNHGSKRGSSVSGPLDDASTSQQLTSPGSTETASRHRTAQIATPVLMKRCRVILDAYGSDQKLLGKCPFPRLRQQELCLVLRRLDELKLVPGVLVAQKGDSSLDCVANPSSQDRRDVLSDIILSGPVAHLFYLSESLTEALFCSDPEVLELIKACLRTSRRWLGLKVGY
ncbi:hypothetical protein BGW38_001685 [Lunasporangiospora selenospora]|uniref:Protein MON2 homolog n=1 Tax=Lunasporangiospora selenospora TaxID=979761 RepID=A0A9P6FT37_9FUNG|nr:hypothetical protein BGW38_001685 [Lunasporangiospora selenospora]